MSHSIPRHNVFKATLCVATLLACIRPVALSAQVAARSHDASGTDRTPRGNHYYTAYGVYAGQEMASWNSQVQVRDTIIDGKTMLQVVHLSRLAPEGGYRYSASAVFDPHEPTNVNVRMAAAGGPAPGACDANYANGSISVTPDGGSATNTAVTGPAVAEFALPYLLADRNLKPGDTLAYNVYRCTWNSSVPSPLFLRAFAGTVTVGKLERGTKKEAEPVWIVTGASDYPLTVWIAQADRQVLRVTIPQGTDGEMHEVYMHTR